MFFSRVGLFALALSVVPLGIASAASDYDPVTGTHVVDAECRYNAPLNLRERHFSLVPRACQKTEILLPDLSPSVRISSGSMDTARIAPAKP